MHAGNCRMRKVFLNHPEKQHRTQWVVLAQPYVNVMLLSTHLKRAIQSTLTGECISFKRVRLPSEQTSCERGCTIFSLACMRQSDLQLLLYSCRLNVWRSLQDVHRGAQTPGHFWLPSFSSFFILDPGTNNLLCPISWALPLGTMFTTEN